MKKILLLIMFCFLMCSLINVQAQIKEPEKVVKNKGTSRANKKIDQGVEKSLDKLEEGIGSLFGKKKQKKDDAVGKSETNQQQTEQQPAPEHAVVNEEKAALNWAKYDFVPGDKVIFEDNLLGEENGEFPSRWDLVNGNVEIGEFDGENVIMFMSGGSCIVPFLKNSEQDYLPDIFTVEFDAYYDVEPHSAKYYVSLFDKKNQKGFGQVLQKIQAFPGGIKYDETDNLIEGSDGLWYNKKDPF